MRELESYLLGLLETYEGQPGALSEALEAFPSSELQRPLGPGEWSPHQVAAHVAAAEQYALGPRLRLILDQEHPRLVDWDESAWMAHEYNPDLPLEEWLALVEQVRDQLSPRLRDLDIKDWNRSGEHPHRGQRTLLWWLEYAVHHVRDHLRQLGAEPV